MNTTDSTNNRLIIVIIGFIIFSSTYMFIGHCVDAEDGMYIIGTGLDRTIPFIPITIWFYLGAYIFSILFGVYKSITSKYFKSSLITIGVASLINFTILFLFPFDYPRPIIDNVGNVVGFNAVIEFGWDNLSVLMIKFIHSFDPPSCTFPSFHMTLSTCFALILCRIDKRFVIIMVPLVLGLFIAILTTKQHFISDGVSGIITALVGYKAGFGRHYGKTT